MTELEELSAASTGYVPGCPFSILCALRGCHGVTGTFLTEYIDVTYNDG